jgi:ABC-type antimicrobial peptide transport system permease subunit
MTSDAPGAVRGRPVLGAIFGLLFGIFLMLTLLQMSVFSLDSAMVIVVPIVMLVLGALNGYFAPLRFLRR